MFQTTNQAILGIYPIGTRQKSSEDHGEMTISPGGSITWDPDRAGPQATHTAHRYIANGCYHVMYTVPIASEHVSTRTYVYIYMTIWLYIWLYIYDICISVFLLRWIRTIYIYHHISYEYILHILMRTHKHTHTRWWSLAWKSGCQHVSTTSTHMCSENGIWKWVLPGIIIGKMVIIH